MLIGDATDRLAGKLRELNSTHLAAGGARDLQSEDWTWERRTAEMRARINLLAADGPTMPLLEALGAHVLATMLALDAAEVADITSGDEAAA